MCDMTTFWVIKMYLKIICKPMQILYLLGHFLGQTKLKIFLKDIVHCFEKLNFPANCEVEIVGTKVFLHLEFELKYLKRNVHCESYFA